MVEKSRQAGAENIEITPEMIEAGRVVLREAFGGETEGANRFVDFPETVERLLRSSLGRP